MIVRNQSQSFRRTQPSPPPPSLPFGISTPSTAAEPLPLSTNPLPPVASVPMRPHAVPVMSSPPPSFSTRSCLRFAFGVGPRRTLADGVASGASHCMSLAFRTTLAPVFSTGSRVTSFLLQLSPRTPRAPLARAPRSRATLGGLGA